MENLQTFETALNEAQATQQTLRRFEKVFNDIGVSFKGELRKGGEVYISAPDRDENYAFSYHLGYLTVFEDGKEVKSGHTTSVDDAIKSLKKYIKDNHLY